MPEIAIDAVQLRLDRIFAEALERADAFGPDYVELWRRLEAASTGGKRARPALVLAAYEAFGGADPEAATALAAAFELLHTAFLIHDDIIDGDEFRRGAPNVAGAFATRARARGVESGRAREWGTAAALLAGDLALSLAHRLVASLDVPAEVRMRLLEIIDRAVFVSAAGELADVAGAINTPPLSEVIATLERKTAVYSCEAPLQAGAVLAGAGEREISALGRFGRFAGIAFQLTDDLLGVFGDGAVTGKSVLADLRAGKATTLLAHAATTDSWAAISALIGDPSLEEDAAAVVREHLHLCGADAETQRLAEQYAALAVAELAASELPETLADELAEFASSAVSRAR
ncbi:polyprenyl synthetase family protein [Rathayibacter sp. YIM 133350]|uniref:polyprenyl synthetase family protein n=1 Tax=Rathayibacter sp. YIM 133350 TaxID=3131992 RepID=UPI00307FC9F6